MQVRGGLEAGAGRGEAGAWRCGGVAGVQPRVSKLAGWLVWVVSFYFDCVTVHRLGLAHANRQM
jgi:hypothetical protein